MNKTFQINATVGGNSINLNFSTQVSMSELALIAAGLLDHISRRNEKTIFSFNSDQESHVINSTADSMAAQNIQNNQTIIKTCLPEAFQNKHNQKIQDFLTFSWPLKATIQKLNELSTVSDA